MVLQTKCKTPWMFGSSTFQQLSLKFVYKNRGNFTELIAMSLFAGFRHYTQHSDVEAVSWMTNIRGWMIRNYKFSIRTLRNHECSRSNGSASTSDTLHYILKLASSWVYTLTELYITTILMIFIPIIYLFIIVFLNLILRPGWRTKVTIHHHGKWKYRPRSCSLRMMD